MQQQYKRLLDASAMPNVRLQVLVAVRDSKDPDGPVLVVAPAAWAAFAARVPTYR
jgi:hypothetical protein